MLMNEERTTVLIDRLLIDNQNSNIETNGHQKKSPLLSSSSTSSSTSSSANTTPLTSAPNSNSNSLNRSLVNSSNVFNDFLEQFELKEKTRRSRSVISTNRDFYFYKSLNEEFNNSEAKRLLKEKDEKIHKLNEIRDSLESEMQELSASLFEEAYAMVNKARDEAALANKLLIEANGKIDVLEAEVKALKTLVTLTNTPTGGICTAVSGASVSTPKHHHLQLPKSSSLLQTSHSSDRLNLNSDSSLLLPNTPTILNNKSNTPSFNRNSFKSHKRTPSHNDVKQAKLTIDLDQINNNNNSNNIPVTPKCEIYEIDPIYFKEIVLWRENPDLDLSNVFIARVYNEDIESCISFNNKELTEQLLAAIQSNSVCIEDISNSHPIDTMQVCSLSNIPSICQYKIKFNESSSQWYLISKLCRNRIISVCDFFTYLRYIKDGLVKSDNRDVYWNIIDLRRRMALSRLGL